MNRIAKTLLLAVVLVAGATCVQARDRGPGDGVKITREIVHGVAQLLNPRPCPPPPPPRWTPPPPPRYHHPAPPPRWTPPPPPEHHAPAPPPRHR